MLPSWVIDEIKRRKEQERRDAERPRIELPVEIPAEQEKKPKSPQKIQL